MIASCSRNENPPDVQPLSPNSNERVYKIGISQNSTQITPEEAAIVAYMERFGAIRTKGDIDASISKTTPICNEQGDTLMFVIEYDNQQGYMVISATKNYHPVLIDVESGEYNPDLISQSGASLYYDAYCTAIESSQEQSKERLAQIRMQWAPYEKYNEPIRPRTKSSNEDILSLVEASIQEWEAEGYNYYFLGQCPNYLPEEIYNRFVSIAEGLSNENYDIYENCVILERRIDSQTNIGPLLETEWNQHRFNHNNQNVYTGCATVALGQILAFHQYPYTFSWQNILNSEESQQSFLQTLAIDLNASFGEDGTGVHINNVKNYLSDNSYYYSHVDHSTLNNLVNSSLENRRPVYMQGFISDEIGHAWVCDGHRSTFHEFRYTLKVISPSEPIYYETADSYYRSTVGNQFYHMNWGWGPNHNGYYLNSAINYQYNRENLVNIRH